jgi:translation elongation factor EF-1alpha
VLNLPEENPVLSAGSTGLILHIHTAMEEIELKKIRGVFAGSEDKDGKQKLNKKLSVLGSHQTGIVVIKAIHRELCVEKFSENQYPKLGHFTIRDQ